MKNSEQSGQVPVLAGIGRWLRAQRDRLLMTQEELAGQAGVSVRTVQMIESGMTRAPRQATLRLILEALNRANGARPSAGPITVPAQLPAYVNAFTGREHEITTLDALLETSTAAGSAPVVCVVSGTAGVGKTALAVYWAHRVLDRFPDGQLFVDLRGYDPDAPVPADTALTAFLHGLGLAGTDAPSTPGERAALYRTLVAGRRMLVLLDNAAHVAQILPLLPDARRCFTLVTSRSSLDALARRDGGHRIDLDLLPPGRSTDLLVRLIGGRARTDPVAAGGLAGRCARLPLALRIAAEYVAGRPGVPLTTFVEELADERSRLDLFDAEGDERTAVRTVFSWSYRNLPAGQARAFRLLGLSPTREIDDHAVAALLATDLAQARGYLAALSRASLIRQVAPGRYGMHDLLRAYAREQATGWRAAVPPAPGRPPNEHGDALNRLFGHAVASVAAAVDALLPFDRHLRPQVPRTVAPVGVPADADGARAWLATNRADLVRICAAAADSSHPERAVTLSRLLWRHLDDGSHHADALAIHGAALRAARSADDAAGEAAVLRFLGLLYARMRRFDTATDHLRRALSGLRGAGDVPGIAGALSNLAVVAWHQGRYDETLELTQRALTMFEAVGDRASAGQALGNIAGVYHRRGWHEEAIRTGERALAVFREIGDRYGVGRTVINLGLSCECLGRYEEALDWYTQALTIFREAGNRSLECRGLANLTSLHLRLGHCEEARGHGTEAVAVASRIGDRSAMAIALDYLGAVQRCRGIPEEALGLHRQALAIAREIGEPFSEARAVEGIAEAHWQAGRVADARRYWRIGLDLYATLGLPDADRVHARLAATGGPG